MGCDIHSMVEVRRKRYEGSWVPESGLLAGGFRPGSERWVALDTDDEHLFPNTYYDPDSTYKPFQVKYRGAPLDDRNYDLFALLAGVRMSGRELEPLSPPRGVPTDASFGWLKEVDDWGPDFHSHSWFTLAELIAFRDAGRLNQTLHREGVISAEQYEALKQGTKPQEWSGGISGFGIVTVTAGQYDAGDYPTEIDDADRELLAKWRARPDANHAHYDKLEAEGVRIYVRAEWDDDPKEGAVAPQFSELGSAITALERYAADLPPQQYVDDGSEDKPGWGHGTTAHEDIRIVFAFDN